MASVKLPVARDIFERVASTFVIGALGVWTASGIDVAHVFDLSVWRAVGIGGVMAVLSLIKNVLAQITSGGGGSLDPAVKLALEPMATHAP